MSTCIRLLYFLAIDRVSFSDPGEMFLRGVIFYASFGPEFYIMTASSEIDDPAAVLFVFRAISSGYPVIGPIKESLMRVFPSNDAPSMMTDFIEYHLKRLTRV